MAGMLIVDDLDMYAPFLHPLVVDYADKVLYCAILLFNVYNKLYSSSILLSLFGPLTLVNGNGATVLWCLAAALHKLSPDIIVCRTV